MHSARLIIHDKIIERYKGLLSGDLTAYERRYIEDALEKERAARKWLTSGRVTALAASDRNR